MNFFASPIPWILGSVLAAAPPAVAPMEEFPPHITWQTGQKIVLGRNHVAIEGQGSLPAGSWPTPGTTIWTAFREGRFWALQLPHQGIPPGETEERLTQSIWTLEPGGEWQRWGTLKPPYAFAVALEPLEHDQILLFPHFMSTHGYFKVDKATLAPMALLEKTASDELRLRTRVLLDIGDPERRMPDGTLQRGKNYLVFANMMCQTTCPIFQVGDGFFLMSRHLGVLWYFNGHGELKRRFQLIDEMRDDAFADLWHYQQAVLGAQVHPDGTLRLVARSKEAVFFSQDIYPSYVGPDGHGLPQEIKDYNEAKSQKLHPELVWWEVDPRDAKPHTISAPPNASIWAYQVSFKQDLLFDFTPAGDIVFPGTALAPPQEGSVPDKANGILVTTQPPPPAPAEKPPQ